MNIDAYISELVRYALDHHLMCEEDVIYSENRILALLKITEYKRSEKPIDYKYVHELLQPCIAYACEHKIIDNTQAQCDRFDSAIMDCLMNRPSSIIHHFNHLKIVDCKRATDYYYALSCASNYIRQDRIAKNKMYKVNTDFGTLDITINLSKPEKDPRDIVMMKKNTYGYPSCALCKENEGYFGNDHVDGRSNHRIIPVNLHGEAWFLQYSPYVYYQEHCILFKGEHTPMRITKDTFLNLLSFVEQFPHYTIGSNADLPIVGGSILAHDHFQGGRFTFAMENAKVIKEYDIFASRNVKVKKLSWPLTVLRLTSESLHELVDVAGEVLQKWQQYDDMSVEVKSHSGKTPHNTITPIARKRENQYELDLVLRNNRTSDEHPYGIFHPHKEIHHIKKENIGLIEVMGLAVLPARLLYELEEVQKYLLHEVANEEACEKHKDWIYHLNQCYTFTAQNAEAIIHEEVGNVFLEGLMHCGVFKLDEAGCIAYDTFIYSLIS